MIIDLGISRFNPEGVSGVENYAIRFDNAQRAAFGIWESVRDILESFHLFRQAQHSAFGIWESVRDILESFHLFRQAQHSAFGIDRA